MEGVKTDCIREKTEPTPPVTIRRPSRTQSLALRGCREERRDSGEEGKRGGPVRPGAPRLAPARRPSSQGAPSVLGQVLTRGAERQCDGDCRLLGDLPKQHKINPVLFPREGSSNSSTSRGTTPSPTFCSPGGRALRLLQPQGRAFQLKSRSQWKEHGGTFSLWDIGRGIRGI